MSDERVLQSVILPAEAFATGESIAAFFDANPAYSRADACDATDERWGGTAKAFVQFPAIDVDDDDAAGGECRDLSGGAKGLYFRRKAHATAEPAAGAEAETAADGAGDAAPVAPAPEATPKFYGGRKTPHGAACLKAFIGMAHETHRTLDHAEVKSLVQEVGRKSMKCLAECYPGHKMEAMYDGDDPDFGDEPVPKAADAEPVAKSIAPATAPVPAVDPKRLARLDSALTHLNQTIYRTTGQEV